MNQNDAIPTVIPTVPPTVPPTGNAAGPSESAPAVSLSPVVAIESTPQIDIELFAQVALRVAQIESAERIEKSKKLLKLQVNLGPELGSRQILSGIALHYEPEALVGRRIVVVANLKPAKFMGLESHGMLLAGSTSDSSVLALLEPDSRLPLGATVR